MPLRFLFWLSWMWLGLSLLFGFTTTTATGYLDPNSNPQLQDVFLLSEFRMFQLPFDLRIPVPTFSFFTSLVTLLTWDYGIFNGYWNLFRLFVLMPISFGTTLLIMTTLGPVIISLLSAIGNFFRGILDLIPGL